MAHGHYQKLDDEERALHDSWQRVLRMVLGVMGLSVVVWAAATVRRRRCPGSRRGMSSS